MTGRFFCAAILCVLAGTVSAGASPSVSSPAQAPGRTQPPAVASGRAEAYHLFLLARQLESAGDADGAAQALQRAARLDPGAAEILAELAGLHARQDREREAIDAAEAALKVDPSNVEAHRVLGMVYGSLAHVDDPDLSLDAEGARYAAEAIKHLEAADDPPRRAPEPGLQLLLGRLYLATGHPDKAIQPLADLVLQALGGSEVVRLLVQAYEGAGRTDEAITLLTAEVKSAPQLFPTLAGLYERQQRWREAADTYERAASLYPDNLGLKTRWAMALLSAGGKDAAVRARDLLAGVLKASPADTRALYLMVEAQRALDDLDGAEATARRLVAVDPSNPVAAEALAEVLAERSAFAEIVRLLEPLVGAAASPPSRWQPRDRAMLEVRLGVAYLEAGEFESAIRTLERAKAQLPSILLIDVSLAQAHLDAGHPDEAIRIAREARGRQTVDQRLARIEAEALRRTGRMEEAVALLRELIAARPGDPLNHVALAELYAAAGRFPEAIDVLRAAQQQMPDDLTLLFQEGAVLERARRYGDAEAVFRRVIARDPLHALALNYLGYMMADRADRLDEAIGFIKRAVAIEPYNPAFLDSLGWAYFRQRKLDLAEKYLAQAAAARVRDSAIQDHHGDLLRALGRVSEAIAAWERALAGDGEQVDLEAIRRKIQAARRTVKVP